MTGRLQWKVAMVIGAGSIGPGWGNGKAAAVLFARQGARVFAVDRRADAAGETCEIIQSEGGEATPWCADVTEPTQVAEMVAGCLRRYGRIDVLHHNVGVVGVGGPVDLPVDEWDRIMAVNVRSMFLTTKNVLPVMEQQGSGAIITVSSVASIRWVGYPAVAYCASKGAVNQLTQSIAVEYAAKGIRANAILPGLLDTPLVSQSLGTAYGEAGLAEMRRIRNAMVPTGRMGDAWDVAYAALFLASDEARYINGHMLVVDGGLTCKF